MCEKKISPSMDVWLKEAKAHESAEKIGMYLTHNGVVRKSAKAKVRLEETDTKEIPPCMILKSDGASLYTTTDLHVWHQS